MAAADTGPAALFHSDPLITDSDALIPIMVCYAATVIVCHAPGFLIPGTRRKLALETRLMIAFIPATLWHTGLVESPLLNPCRLVIIAGAITLGKVMTLLELMRIATCCLFMSHARRGDAFFSPQSFTLLIAKFSPFLPVAHVTSMLAHDILTARKRITILSQVDELTGLPHPRAFNPVPGREIARASRDHHPFSLLKRDVDGLKGINDRHGHPAAGCCRAPSRRSRAASGLRTRWRVTAATSSSSCWRIAERRRPMSPRGASATRSSAASSNTWGNVSRPA